MILSSPQNGFHKRRERLSRPKGNGYNENQQSIVTVQMVIAIRTARKPPPRIRFLSNHVTSAVISIAFVKHPAAIDLLLLLFHSHAIEHPKRGGQRKESKEKPRIRSSVLVETMLSRPSCHRRGNIYSFTISSGLHCHIVGHVYATSPTIGKY